MTSTATFIGNEISVRHSVRPDVRREFLAFSIDNAWDDVKKVHKKVLKDITDPEWYEILG